MPAKSKKQSKYKLGSSVSDAGAVDLPCPTGALVRVRRPGVPGLIKMGLLDSLDQLTSLVQVEHFQRVGAVDKTAEAIQAFASDTEKVDAAFKMMHKLVVGVVIEPKVLPVPVWEEGTPQAGEPMGMEDREENDAAWDEDAVYVDTVDLTDMMFIMQFVVGGSNDLAAFRQGLTEAVVGVADVQDAPVPAKRASRSRGAASSVLPQPGSDDVRPTTGRGAGRGRAGTGRAKAV